MPSGHRATGTASLWGTSSLRPTHDSGWVEEGRGTPAALVAAGRCDRPMDTCAWAAVAGVSSNVDSASVWSRFLISQTRATPRPRATRDLALPIGARRVRGSASAWRTQRHARNLRGRAERIYSIGSAVARTGAAKSNGAEHSGVDTPLRCNSIKCGGSGARGWRVRHTR